MQSTVLSKGTVHKASTQVARLRLLSDLEDGMPFLSEDLQDGMRTSYDGRAWYAGSSGHDFGMHSSTRAK